MAALEPEHLGGAGDIAVIFIKFLQDVVAFVSVARLVQSGKFAFGAAAAIAVHQWRKMFGIETGSRGVHYDDALDYIAKLAHIAGPGIAHQNFDRIVGDFARTP